MELAHYIYEPLKVDDEGTISKSMLEQNLMQSFWPSQLELMVIEPFGEAFKKSGKRESHFKDFSISISTKGKQSKKWKEVYEKFNAVLEMANNEDRAKKSKILKHKEGIGYCLEVDFVLRLLTGLIKRSTGSGITSPRVVWPTIKKTDYKVRDIVVPNIDYSQLTEEAASVAMQARRFNSSLDDEVFKAYTRANEIWFRRQTGYDRENIPPKEKSPIKRVRHMGDYSYIIINLVREDKPKYSSIIKTIIADLNKIKEGERGKLWELYRPTEDGFVNAKKLQERLNNLYNHKDNIKPDVRYEIVPS